MVQDQGAHVMDRGTIDYNLAEYIFFTQQVSHCNLSDELTSVGRAECMWNPSHVIYCLELKRH